MNAADTAVDAGVAAFQKIKSEPLWRVGKVVKVQGLDFRIASIGPRGRLILKVVK